MLRLDLAFGEPTDFAAATGAGLLLAVGAGDFARNRQGTTSGLLDLHQDGTAPCRWRLVGVLGERTKICARRQDLGTPIEGLAVS